MQQRKQERDAGLAAARKPNPAKRMGLTRSQRSQRSFLVPSPLRSWSGALVNVSVRTLGTVAPMASFILASCWLKACRFPCLTIRMQILVYEFRAPLHTATGTWPVVVKAARAQVEPLIPLHEFAALFGGYVMWAPALELGAGVSVGVWGRRNAGRFRRILRERGAVVRIAHESGPDQPLALVSQSYETHTVAEA
jgi:hypothetical protein